KVSFSTAFLDLVADHRMLPRHNATSCAGDMGAHMIGTIWMAHMQTTVESSDSLLREARKTAAREGVTLRTLIERGLHRVVAETKPGAPFKLRRASFKGKGLQPGL